MNPADNRPKRGLGALLAATTQNAPASTDSTSPTPSAASQVSTADVPILTIRRNAAQPRVEFDPIALNELANSIKERGLIQPVVVRPLKPEEIVGDVKFELIAGERRWRASQMAGLTAIPIVIKQVFDERDILLLSLVENLQRDDLNAIEEAIAYDKLAKTFTLTHETIAIGVGKSRAYISNCIRMLELPAPVIDALRTKKITMGHAKLLLAIPDAKLQAQFAAKTQAENLTVKDLERLTVNTLSPEPQRSPTPIIASTQPVSPARPKTKGTRNTRMPSSEIQDLERRLREHFGTKVMIEEGARRGQVIIEFFSQDDLQRIITLLGMDD